MSKTRSPKTHTVTWTCLTCGDGKVIAGAAGVYQHALDVHGVTLKGTKGFRKLLLAMDGSGFYANHYEWDFGKVKLQQSTTGPA